MRLTQLHEGDSGTGGVVEHSKVNSVHVNGDTWETVSFQRWGKFRLEDLTGNMCLSSVLFITVYDERELAKSDKKKKNKQTSCRGARLAAAAAAGALAKPVAGLALQCDWRVVCATEGKQI